MKKGIINKIISKYKSLSFEDRTIFMTKFSIGWNVILGVGKFILAIFSGLYFVVAGIINIIISAEKAECYFGMAQKKGRSFEKRNLIISILMFLSGLQYTIYIVILLVGGRGTSNFGEIIGICIALVAFVELGISIYGLVKVKSKGHYYRNIKIINFCSALTAIALTENALMSFAGDKPHNILSGIFGIVVGSIIMILSIFVYFAPKYSIVDKEHHVYKTNKTDQENLEIMLKYSKFYGGYKYHANIKDGICDGHIVRTKGELFKAHWSVLTIMIILSEILIFPYAIGAIVNYFKCFHLIEKLDEIMEKEGFIKIEE